MDIQFDKKIDSYGILTIRIKKEDYKSDLNKELRAFARKTTLKGFRRGKIPAGVINKIYGSELKAQVVNKKVSEWIDSYVKKHEIRLLFPPANRHQSADTNHQVLESEDFDLSFDLCFEPAFTYDLTKYSFKFYEINPSEADVEKRVASIQELHASFEDTTEEAEREDCLFGVATSGELIEENFSLMISAIAEEQQNQFIGLKAKDVVRVDFTKIFTSEQLRNRFHLEPDADLVPYQNEWEYTVTKVERKKQAELNQEFFDKILGKEKVASEKEFKDYFKDSLSRQMKDYANTLLHNEIKAQLLKDATFELPEDFLKNRLYEYGKSQAKKLGKPQIDTTDKNLLEMINSVRWEVIYNKIGRDAQIEVTTEEIRTQAKVDVINLLDTAQLQNNKLDELIDDYLEYEQGENRTKISQKIFTKKIFDYLKQHLKLETQKVDIASIDKILEEKK